MQSKWQGSWAVWRLWCGVAWTLWTLLLLSLVPVAMCQHGLHRHYWQDHRCQQHCHCHHQCLFCVLGVIFKSIDNLGHYVPIVAKSCFDHIFKMQLEYPYFVNAIHIEFLFCTTFLIVALNLLTIKSVATLVFRHSSWHSKKNNSSMDDDVLVKWFNIHCSQSVLFVKFCHRNSGNKCSSPLCLGYLSNTHKMTIIYKQASATANIIK